MYDLNRMPMKAGIDYQRMFLESGFKYLVINLEGRPDPSLAKVVDAVFKDIFGEKKVFSKLLKSNFAPDTFSPYSEMNFQNLLGLFDSEDVVKTIRDLVLINSRIRWYDKKIRNNKHDRRKVTKLSKEHDALCKTYRKCVKKMKKIYGIGHVNEEEFAYAKAFLKNKQDDFDDWFSDDYEPTYQWGNGVTRGGRFEEMMKRVADHERMFYEDVPAAFPSHRRSDVVRPSRPYPQDLSQARFTMNGPVPYPVDEDDDDDDMDMELTDLDYDRYEDMLTSGKEPMSQEVFDDIMRENPALMQAMYDNVGKSEVDVEDDLNVDEDDDDDDDIYAVEPDMSQLDEVLDEFEERLDRMEEVLDNLPSMEGIAKGIDASVSKHISAFARELTPKLEKFEADVDRRLTQMERDILNAPAENVEPLPEPVEVEVVELVEPVEEVKEEQAEEVVSEPEVPVERVTQITISTPVVGEPKQVAPVVTEEASPRRVMINNNQVTSMEGSKPDLSQISPANRGLAEKILNDAAVKELEKKAPHHNSKKKK